MKILITGASGFIGGFLVEKALEKGFETWAGVRTSSSRKYLRDPRTQFIDFNYDDPESLKKQIAELRDEHGKFDCIVHNMGITKCNDKRDFDKINYLYTKNFVEALLANDMIPKRFIYMSSLSAWGPGDSLTGRPIMLADEAKPNTLYGQSKLKAEQFLQTVPDLPYVFVRPTGVYGPREKDYFVFNKTIAGGLEPSMGFKIQYLTFVYVRDLVKFVFRVIESDIVRKGYFVTDGKVYTNKEYANIVKKHLGVKRTIKIKIPLFLVKGISYFLDTVYGWFGKSPTLNRDKYKLLSVTNWKCEIKALKTDFDFTADYDLDRGTEEAIAWYKQEKWL
ncbi:MAG: NAD(P)-dependent oxidoreductase [Prevotellaceae bacterium]|jgi:nucleoside-diphosphate-sugar epimerase|nr:NAD(P)-dependent oxidoreductase [Prevotellaceae bacterium]